MTSILNKSCISGWEKRKNLKEREWRRESHDREGKIGKEICLYKENRRKSFKKMTNKMRLLREEKGKRKRRRGSFWTKVQEMVIQNVKLL